MYLFYRLNNTGKYYESNGVFFAASHHLQCLSFHFSFSAYLVSSLMAANRLHMYFAQSGVQCWCSLSVTSMWRRISQQLIFRVYCRIQCSTGCKPEFSVFRQKKKKKKPSSDQCFPHFWKGVPSTNLHRKHFNNITGPCCLECYKFFSCERKRVQRWGVKTV